MYWRKRITINTTENVEEIMLEHLKNLKEAAEDCDECQLGGITNAMVQTAGFLTNLHRLTENEE